RLFGLGLAGDAEDAVTCGLPQPLRSLELAVDAGLAINESKAGAMLLLVDHPPAGRLINPGLMTAERQLCNGQHVIDRLLLGFGRCRKLGCDLVERQAE